MHKEVHMFWKKSLQPLEAKLRWGLLGVFGVTMLVNGVAGSTTWLGGVDTAQVSDSFPNLFAPAGATFAIWSVIYALLVGFIAYAWGWNRHKNSKLPTATLRRVAQLLVGNLLLNAVWIFAWQYKVLWLSVLLMIGILVTLVKIVEELRPFALGGVEFVLAKLPFSVYFGWITVATVANITTWLVSIGWDGFGIRAGVWTVVVLLVAAAIGLLGAIRNHDVAYLAVFVWAFAGILIKHLSPHGHNGMYPTIIIVLTILLAVFVSVGVQLSREVAAKK